MGVSLNIMKRELEAMGNVSISSDRSLNFENARLYLGESSIAGDDILYVCSTSEDCESVRGYGRHAAFVDHHATKPDQTAVLSVTGGEGTLQVFNALLEIFYRFGMWERDMDAVLGRGGGLQELMDVSEKMLRNNVVVVDPALKLLAYTKGTPCDDPITMELIGHGYHTEENIRKFQLHKRFKPWAKEDGFIVNDTLSICKYVTVVRSFKTKTSFSLIVVMMCNKLSPCDYLYDTFDLFLSRVKRIAEREYPEDKPSGNAVDTFLHDLLLGREGNEAIIRERCKLVGIPPEARFCLFAIPVTEDMSPSRLLSDLATMVAPAKVVLFDGCVTVLCFNCLSPQCALHCEVGSCPRGHKSISSRINELMEKMDLICGRSSKFTNLAKASIAYRQAREAARLGAKAKPGAHKLPISFNWSRIFSFDRAQIAFIADKMGDDLPLLNSTYASVVVRSIAKDDAERGTDNYQFLYEYLMCERRANIVAEKLHMHRNNVKYRIDRIEGAYGIDTSDPALRFALLFAYRFDDIEIMQNAQ